MASEGEHCCSCCSPPVSPSVYQTVNEMDFERGIWSAAMDGDLKRVQSLIQKGIHPNLKDSAGYTALHYASRNGHLTVCEFLLENGACASPQTPGGGTPLHRAAFCGRADVVRLLLHRKADPMTFDDDGASPLHKAAEQGHEKVCQLLLEACPALCSQKNKRLQLPCHMAPQEHLQKLLKQFL
ncbi:ankyrin repeat domain-containing protein 39 isoform X2 [Phyllopteryx taeniolatus]|uniref:ankyrin repeat domain-containing protein 39 isoform X2 n=1 Tax=Phyllopteryx taeniolatus TaxID=161469 RepID=UPI002AD41CC7|nr:ankyrin repeat domain-containing protein 39 isoform X2 [Phyllopteryx taeniolatus]